MWKFASIGLVLVVAAVQSAAQAPTEKPELGKQKDYSESSIVKRMLAFNKKNDGKLTKEEVTDPRLHRLFDLADVNKDGIVTREELIALAAKMQAETGQGGPGDKGFGGPKGPGGKGKGRGGFGGPGGAGGGRSQPGQILAMPLQEQLNLTGVQKRQLKELQKQVDNALAKILTDQQRQQLKDMGQNGPGGFGPPGGGGFGPPPGGPFDDGPPNGKRD